MSAAWSPTTLTGELWYRAEHDRDRVVYRFLGYGADDDPVVSEIKDLGNRLWSILDGARSYRRDAETEPDDDLERVSDEDVFDLIDKETGAA